MKKVATKASNKKGFSLIELMVVVAIIGILAAIAVPQYSKFMMQTKQSEAKGMLSSLYTGEKTFYISCNGYAADFGNIGYGPEGDIRYNVGFGAGSPSACGPGSSNTFATLTLCGAIGSTARCRNTTESNGGTGIANTRTAGATSFVAAARSKLSTDATTVDEWTITETQVFANTSNGLQ